MASSTATKQTLYVKARTIGKSPKYPGYYWCRVFDPKKPTKPMSVAYKEEQVDFIDNAADNSTPLHEDIHYRYCPDKEGTFLLPNVGIEQFTEVPIEQQAKPHKIRKAPARGTTNQEHVYDDLIEDDEPPLSWDASRDPRLIKAETFAREIAYLAETLIKEHPSLNREDCRAIANTAFIQAQKS